MRYELTITITLESSHSQDRLARLMESVFEFSTMKEAIAEGLKLGNDPHLVGVAVKATRKNNGTVSAA